MLFWRHTVTAHLITVRCNSQRHTHAFDTRADCAITVSRCSNGILPDQLGGGARKEEGAGSC